MKRHIVRICVMIAAVSTAMAGGKLELWYKAPAKEWTEALPIGNGRLAAMVFGGTAEERLQINEDTLWGGGPYDPSQPGALAALPEVRKLVFAGDYQAAQGLAGKMMARPLRQMPYQTVGDLKLQFAGHDEVTDYRRSLDLDTAVVRTTYTCDGVTYTREAFVSPVDQVVVIRIACDKPGALTFTASMSSPQDGVSLANEGSEVLVMKGHNGAAQRVAGALTFQCRVKILATGGTIISDGKSTSVTNADSATLLLAAATSYKSWNDVSGDPDALCRSFLGRAGEKSFEVLRRDHVAEHQRLFRRVSLDLGTTEAAKLLVTSQGRQIPTQSPEESVCEFATQTGKTYLISHH